MYNQNSGIGRMALQALYNFAPTIGKVFFVGDSGTVDLTRIKALFTGDPDGKLHFFSDLETCLNSGALTANRQDVILLAPGHAETVSSATTINLDVAGVTIIGLGTGLNRPIITFDTATTATIPVTAANITIKNVIFSANFADIVSTFTIGAAKDFRLEDCSFLATATNMNFLHVIDTGTTDNSADGLTVVNCKWFEPDAATLAFGLIDATLDRVHIEGNLFVTGNATANTAALFTIATGKNLKNVYIGRNRLYVTGNSGSTAGLLITTDGTAGTGIIEYNFLKHADATTEILITATHTYGLFENRATAVANAQGYLLPAIDA